MASHNLARYGDSVPPSFVKKVNDKLSISLSYISQPQNDIVGNKPEFECLISFHNTLSTDTVVVNPKTPEHESSSSWFNIWGSHDDKTTPLVGPDEASPETSILLGYLQLFGFVTLNYKFDLSQANSMDSSHLNSWWHDKEYYDYYQDGGKFDEDEGDIKESKIEKTEFIQQHYLHNRMIVGGKLGGVGDLVVNNDKNADSHTVNKSNKYLISDLIYNFNSATKPKPAGVVEIDQELEKSLTLDTEGLPIKELTDSIVPIYSTSQYLLFTNLKLAQNSTKTFQVKFSGPGAMLPPSYNTNLTGLVGDQGWISIRYQLIVGILENVHNSIVSKSIYFPLKIVGQKVGFDDKWLQPDYLTKTQFEKDWQVDVIEDEADLKHDTPAKTTVKTKQSFLNDLNNLIESDLHSVSKNERRKSSTTGGIFNPDLNDIDLIPQLTSHMKTQFQIRVNDHNLCDLILSKTYYHIGEDISYNIDINPGGIDFTRVVGIITHLEAHEVYHLKGKVKSDDYVNIYKVSPNNRVNTFASSLVNSHGTESEDQSSLFSGLIHIPQHLSQQFQCSSFMDLKYFLVFKFNLNEFDRVNKKTEPVASNGNEASTESPPTSPLVPQPSVSSSPSLATSSSNINYETLPSGFEPEYKFDNNNGSEFRFRIPIVLLP